MNICVILFIIIIIGIIVFLCRNVIKKFSDIFSATGVESTTDGFAYNVQEHLHCPSCASDVLAEIHRRNTHLIQHLNRNFPNDPRVQRLVRNYHRQNIYEGIPDGGTTTSYTLNKGEKLVFCLRSSKNPTKIHEVNLLMYVSIHELSHIASESYGHNAEFRRNFSWLLRNAVNIGIWNYQNYGMVSKEYCGIKIDRTHYF